MSDEKIEFISIVRGIGILLVVAGHCITGKITNFIYLFHMPLFFMMSGYLFKQLNKGSALLYIKNKAKTLYVPYLMWNIVFLLLHNVFFEVGFYQNGFLNLEPIYSIKVFLKELIGILTLTHMEQVTAPTWYLRVIFVASILYFLMNKYICRTIIFNILSIVSFIFIYLIYFGGWISNSIIIYSVLVLLAVVFMRMGYIYRLLENKINYSYWGIAFSFIILLVLNEFGHINIVSIEFENPVYLTATSFLGIYLTFGIAKRIVKGPVKHFFTYLGEHTMIILILHCAAFKLVNVIYGLVNRDMDSMKNVANASNWGWGCIYIIVGIIVPLCVDFAIKGVYFSIVKKLKGEKWKGSI